MKITLLDYIKNPMGGNVMTNRAMYHQLYVDKFDKLLVRENGRIEYHLYRDAEDYIIHFKIPSEKIAKFYYDVVFRFTPNSAADKDAKTLNNYSVTFFSNDPSFIFTYANVFIKNKLIMEDLLDKIPAKAKKEPPKETNPKNIIGYVKSFYFAYLVMKQHGLFNKVVFSGNGRRYFKVIFTKQIEHADKKIDERISKGEHKDIISKARDKIKKAKSLNPIKNALGIKSTPTTKNTTKTKLTKTFKPIRKTKLTKKI